MRNGHKRVSPLRVLHALVADVGALHASVSTLPPPTPVRAGKTGMEWQGRLHQLGSAQLVQHAKAAGSGLESASIAEAHRVIGVRLTGPDRTGLFCHGPWLQVDLGQLQFSSECQSRKPSLSR